MYSKYTHTKYSIKTSARQKSKMEEEGKMDDNNNNDNTNNVPFACGTTAEGEKNDNVDMLSNLINNVSLGAKLHNLKVGTVSDLIKFKLKTGK